MKTASLLLTVVIGSSLATGSSVLADEAVDQTQFKGLTLRRWIDRLANGKSRDTSAAWDAPPTEALEALPLFGTAAVPLLIKALQNESHFVRYNAATALALIDADRKAAIPVLTKLLNDEHVQIRAGAADALSSIGPDAAAAIPELAKLLDDTATHSIGAPSMFGGKWFYWSPSRSARWALIAIGPKSVPVFLKRLKSEGARARQDAAAALSSFSGEARTIVPELIRSLDDPEPAVRGTAADSLARHGVAAKSATSALAGHVADSGQYAVAVSLDMVGYETVASRAVEALRAIGPSSEDVSSLIDVLTTESDARSGQSADFDRPPDPRPDIIELLGELRDEAQDSLPALAAALDDARLRCSAALALARLEARHPRVRVVLLDCLGDGDSENTFASQRLQIAGIIRDRRWTDESVVAALKLALRDKDGHVRLIAAGTLLSIDPDHEQGRRVFVETLCSDDISLGLLAECDPDIWKEVVATLKESPCAATLAAPVLVDYVTAEYLTSIDDRRWVFDTLTVIGTHGASEVPRLSQQLETAEEVRDRQGAAVALGAVGYQSRRAASALLYAMNDSDPVVRASAADSLGKVGVAEEVVIEQLKAASMNEERDVRENAARALKRLEEQRHKP